MELREEDKRVLLKLARSSIASALRHVHEELPEFSGVLREPRGAFVTLRLEGELRGCIGYVEAKVPLFQAIMEVAYKAAFQDPRFPQVRVSELDLIDIEISVLSPLLKVEDVETIEIGKHGLVLEAGFARGLLLPHVATEHSWNREEFLNHTALKAGLPTESWKTGRAQLYSFTTITFSESTLFQPQ